MLCFLVIIFDKNCHTVSMLLVTNSCLTGIVFGIVTFSDVGEVGTKFEFFMCGFVPSLVLTFYLLVLDLEFDSLSNDVNFGGIRRAPNEFRAKNVIFQPFFYIKMLYFLSGFALSPVLSLKMAV